jgi:hypothetical protein
MKESGFEGVVHRPHHHWRGVIKRGKGRSLGAGVFIGQRNRGIGKGIGKPIMFNNIRGLGGLSVDLL